MKNLLGIIFEGKEDPELVNVVGQKYVVKTLDEKISEEMTGQQTELENLEKKTQPPQWMKNAKMLSIFMCMGFLILYVVLSTNVTSSALFIVLIPAAVCIIFYGIISLLQKKNRITPELEQQAQKLIKKMRVTCDRARQDLGIPRNAIEVDMLTEKYVLKNGKLVSKSLIAADYANLTQFIYKKDGMFYVSGIDMSLAFPIEQIKAIKKVNKKATFMGWNKNEPYNSPKLKAYNVKMTSFKVYSVSPYYEIIVDNGEEQNVMKLPSYELKAFTKMLSVPVIEDEPVKSAADKEKKQQ